MSEWIEAAGYRLIRAPTTENLLASISQKNEYIDATEIIHLVEQQVLDSRFSGSTDIISSASFREIQEVGDNYFAKGDYRSAMDVYITLTKQYAVDYPGLLLKIAQVYNHAECYRDSVMLTYFALNHVKDAVAKGKLYHLLASAFDELCRRNPNPGILQQALNFYREASDLSGQLNTVVLWNKFDLIVNFINTNQDHYDQHIKMAKIAWIEFKNSTTHETSNFQEYVQEILSDMKKVISRGIKDPWLTAEINRFVNQLS